MAPTARFTIRDFNLITFIILFELFFLLIIYKVFHVPVTHDEVLTATRYPGYGYWELMMYPEPWPNNHILNSLLAKFFVSIFGLHQWVVRLPNVLSFLLYSYAIFRINKTVLTTSSVWFIPASVLFLLNLYLLDFFGLSRGYGISCALCTLSVSFLISAFRDLKKGDGWIAFFAAMLASYANFTALVFWVAVSAMVWACFFIRFRKLGKNLVRPTILMVLFIAGYALLIANPIIKKDKYIEALVARAMCHTESRF